MTVAGRPAEAEFLDPLVDDPSDAVPRAHLHAYAQTGKGVHAIPLDSALAVVRRGLAGRLPEDPPVVWIDIAAPGTHEAEFLRDRMGFHPLAVEDTIRGRQRPKIDRYPGYYFLVLYAARINHERGRMSLNELHAFIGEGYIVTIHDHRIDVLTQVLARWRAAPEQFRSTGVLAHALLDMVVDGYFPVIDHFSERVSAIETGVLGADREEAMQTILGMRRELALFRRMVGPERELIGSLLRRDLPFLDPDMLPYFQDVHDHAIRVAEEIDTLRDLLGGAMDGFLSLSSHQLNETMRLMAAWSIILMAMAWIAGIYGMNFRHMPELRWPLGYLWGIGLMLAVGAGLFVYFRRQRWI